MESPKWINPEEASTSLSRYPSISQDSRDLPLPGATELGEKLAATLKETAKTTALLDYEREKAAKEIFHMRNLANRDWQLRNAKGLEEREAIQLETGKKLAEITRLSQSRMQEETQETQRYAHEVEQRQERRAQEVEVKIAQLEMESNFTTQELLDNQRRYMELSNNQVSHYSDVLDSEVRMVKEETQKAIHDMEEAHLLEMEKINSPRQQISQEEKIREIAYRNSICKESDWNVLEQEETSNISTQLDLADECHLDVGEKKFTRKIEDDLPKEPKKEALELHQARVTMAYETALMKQEVQEDRTRHKQMLASMDHEAQKMKEQLKFESEGCKQQLRENRLHSDELLYNQVLILKPGPDSLAIQKQIQKHSGEVQTALPKTMRMVQSQGQHNLHEEQLSNLRVVKRPDRDAKSLTEDNSNDVEKFDGLKEVKKPTEGIILHVGRGSPVSNEEANRKSLVQEDLSAISTPIPSSPISRQPSPQYLGTQQKPPEPISLGDQTRRQPKKSHQSQTLIRKKQWPDRPSCCSTL